MDGCSLSHVDILVVDSAIKWKKILEDEHGCDLVVPMTHQDVQGGRQFKEAMII